MAELITAEVAVTRRVLSVRSLQWRAGRVRRAEGKNKYEVIRI